MRRDTGDPALAPVLARVDTPTLGCGLGEELLTYSDYWRFK